FFGPGDFRTGFGGQPNALVIDVGFVFIEEPFITNRIPAGVGIQVDIPVGFHPTPDLLARGVVIGIGGPDEAIVGNMQDVAIHFFDDVSIAGGQFHRRKALVNCGLLHLLTVRVSSGQVSNVKTVEAFETRHHIGGNIFICVPDEWFAVWVGNRRCQIVGAHRPVSSKSTSAVISAWIASPTWSISPAGRTESSVRIARAFDPSARSATSMVAILMLRSPSCIPMVPMTPGRS